jgi:hypothetical protein
MTNMISNTNSNEYLTLCQTNSTPVDVYQNIPSYSDGLSFGSVSPELYDYYNSPDYLDQPSVKTEQKLEEPQRKQQQQGDFRPTFYNPFEIKHRRRTSRAQFKVLERTFSENPKPNAAIRRWLAQQLSMTPRGVQVWFQNRRAKAKAQQVKGQQQQQQQHEEDEEEDETMQQGYPLASPHLMTEPLGSRPQRLSTSSYDMPSNEPSPVSTPCGCHPIPFATTPMTRTLSYPPVYSDSSTADEEEDNLLLMTPMTPYQVPFVDGQFMSDLDYANQFLYDPFMSPIFMNQAPLQRKTWPKSSWSPPQEEAVYPTRMSTDEYRRYSHPHRNYQVSSEVMYHEIRR